MGKTLLIAASLGCALAQGTPEAGRLSWGPHEFLKKGLRNAPWVNDPFFPETTSFRLSGIISEEMAFINGKWFRPGQKIEGYEVRKISSEGVTLTRRGEVLVLKLGE